MRITKRQLKQIIREEAARLEGKGLVSEAYDMENAKRAEGLYANTQDVAAMSRAIEDLYEGIFNDLFDNEGVEEDEADDMARAATVLAVANALGSANFSAAEVLYDHLRKAGRPY
jgi:hypothetical protein